MNSKSSLKFRPLKNQVLISLLPLDTMTRGGLHLPDIVQGAGPLEKAWPRKGYVVAIGAWRTTKQGFSILPDFKPGDMVLVNEYLGTKLTRNIGENYRLCRVDDVLAVLTENGDTQGT